MKKIKYTDAIAQKILNLLSSGKTLVDIQSKGLPSRWTIYQWFVDNPEFEKRFRLAQSCSTDIRIEDVLKRIETCTDTKQAKLLDVLFKSTSWYVSKINRAVYGDKIDVSHTHTLDVSKPIQLALQRLSALRLEPQQERVIEVNHTTIT